VQKQAGHLAIGIKVLLGDFIRMSFGRIVKTTAPMNCVFIKQNIVLRNIKEEFTVLLSRMPN
jgi:hypothetical protein